MGRFAPGPDWQRSLLLGVAMSSVVNPQIRRRLLRLWGATLADTAYIHPDSFFYSPDFDIGDGVFLNRECYVDTYERVTIGRNVWIGPRTMLLTSTHEIGDEQQRAGAPAGKRVYIGEGCWIGANVTILPGVSVLDGCVIAAGAVVTKDCEPNGIYAGNPAKRVRDL
jgi:maltose O-acetyltransferase